MVAGCKIFSWIKTSEYFQCVNVCVYICVCIGDNAFIFNIEGHCIGVGVGGWESPFDILLILMLWKCIINASWKEYKSSSSCPLMAAIFKHEHLDFITERKERTPMQEKRKKERIWKKIQKKRNDEIIHPLSNISFVCSHYHHIYLHSYSFLSSILSSLC